MNLIDRIQNEAELNSVRDHIAKVLADKMSLPLGSAKANERVAWLLGARDWNTALGMVRNRDFVDVPFVDPEPDDRSESEVVVDNIMNFLLRLSGDPTLDKSAHARYFVSVMNCHLLNAGLSGGAFEHFIENDRDRLINTLRTRIKTRVEMGQSGEAILNDVMEKFFGLSFQHIAHAGDVCLKCGSDLDPMGYCEDITCPHCEYGQHVRGYYEGKPTGPLRRVIRATMKTDDGAWKVDFDATPYFIHQLVNGTLESAIADLNAIEWATDYAADQVAEFFVDLPEFARSADYADLNRAFEHNRHKVKSRNRKDDLVGYEVYIQECDVAQWLSERHPKLAKLINV